MAGAPTYGPAQVRKTFVLCFDGTGNKFSGTASDSNILKIFRMLDRTDPSHLHYYQPGIGTYVETRSVSLHTGVFARFNSWYQKAKDSAVGTSFDEHVMGGYKFLMRYYSSGDGGFLAEMLDYVGLLSAGNEEMARFAWKAFAQWQQREGDSEKEGEKKKEMFRFLTGFRETFSRPVRRIRFLGLFDTVNSVPHFENAWMKRSKFPYTARSTAKVIRHAGKYISIDDRRAKFRQDLISETKTVRAGKHHRHHHHHLHRSDENHSDLEKRNGRPDKSTENGGRLDIPKRVIEPPKPVPPTDRFRRPSQAHVSVSRERQKSTSPVRSLGKVSENGASSIRSGSSQMSMPLPPREFDEDEDEDAPQDIQEVWFPGNHADIGGGWPVDSSEKVPLSHGPLVWMVREAIKAGLCFDKRKLLDLCYMEDESGYFGEVNFAGNGAQSQPVPQVQINSPGGSPTDVTGSTEVAGPEVAPSAFRQALIDSATTSKCHDCLEFGGGLKAGSVIWWNMMEYLPFRRMDLQPDNSWKSISWPLPKGEVRDIPESAWIHCSAIRRMEARTDYRPGNLIVGGGGRGVKIAPAEHGIGSWEIIQGEGDPVGEVYLRKKRESELGDEG